ncbi:helix-turn-helix domain-containing protein [Xanthobacter flavus]|uniref:helix-turn-helix domain-containing protein n=1 Tax=Xanthobacter flavus TaxID=281 RepID=UPI003727ED72
MSREINLACRENAELPRVLSVRETSDILRCSEAKVWGMLKAGALRRIKIGASTRIAREDVLRVIAPAEGIFS